MLRAFENAQKIQDQSVKNQKKIELLDSSKIKLLESHNPSQIDSSNSNFSEPDTI